LTRPGSTADANDLVSLADYLRYAALNNAGLKAAFEQWKAALQRVPQVEVLPDPRFTYGYFIREVETRVGVQRQKFGVMQVFPWFGKIEARADAAAAAARAARWRYEAAKLKLFYKVKDAFYEYVYLASAIRIARENLQMIKHFEGVARTKYMAATAGHPDLVRAQVELAKIEDQLKSLENMREPIGARLNAVLNRPSAGMLPRPQKVKPEPVQLRREQIIRTLVNHNPELAALEKDIENASCKVLKRAEQPFQV